MADNSLGAKTGVPVVVPNISEVTAYTPIIAGVTTSATAAYYQIVGTVMNVWGSFTMTTYASAFGVPMPGAYLIDTAKVPRGATLNYSIGTANYEDVSTGFQYYGTCWPTSTTNVQIHGNSGTADTWGSASKPVAAGAGDIVNFWFQVPVAGLSASLAYGAGLATSVKSGLVTPRKEQYDLVVTGTNFTSTRAKGIYYQDQAGNHRLKFNITGTTTAVARSNLSLTITGITTVAVYQAVSSYTETAGSWQSSNAYTGPSSGGINVLHGSASTVLYMVSGDVELASKPSWA